MLWSEHITTDFASLVHKPVVVPVGAIEQHGAHLPVQTDSLIGGEIVRRAEAELGDEALFTPFLWLGSSHHHIKFPGTLSLTPRVYIDVIMDLVECLITAGCRKIVLLNSHGGNINPIGSALYRLQLKYRTSHPDLWLVHATWFVLAAQQIAALKALEQDHVTHACELETSMVQRLRPDLVRMSAARGANLAFVSDFYSPDDSGSSRVDVFKMFEHLTTTGALGHPEHATPEKGEALYTLATTEVVKFVREFSTWKSLQPG